MMHKLNPESDRRFSKPRLLVALLAAVFGTASAQAADDYFTGGDAANPTLYLDAANWSLGTVPDLTTANTAHIANGSDVNYVAGPDLTIKNGGVLEITNGSFTQTSGPAYLQLNGMGTILIDGGTFNQGTSTSGPFNVTGTDNVFNMTSGAANLTRGFNVAAGLTSSLSGGTLNTTGGGTAIGGSLTLSGATATLGNSLMISTAGTLSISGGNASASGDLTNNGALSITNGTINVGRFTNGGSFSMSGGTLTTTGEFDFNDNQNTLSGGTINTTLITGVNGGGGNHVFNITGGALTLSGGSGGIYGGNTSQYINFVAGSTGTIEFLASTNDSISTVQGFIRSNAIEYSDTPYSSATGYSEFSITTDSSGDVFLNLAGMEVPEPATVVGGWLLAGFASPLILRRLWRRAG